MDDWISAYMALVKYALTGNQLLLGIKHGIVNTKYMEGKLYVNKAAVVNNRSFLKELPKGGTSDYLKEILEYLMNH